MKVSMNMLPIFVIPAKAGIQGHGGCGHPEWMKALWARCELRSWAGLREGGVRGICRSHRRADSLFHAKETLIYMSPRRRPVSSPLAQPSGQICQANQHD
jgi:hypothetical protein